MSAWRAGLAERLLAANTDEPTMDVMTRLTKKRFILCSPKEVSVRRIDCRDTVRTFNTGRGSQT